MTRVALGVVAYRDPASLERLLVSAPGFDEVVVVNITADPAVSRVCADHGARDVLEPGNPGFAAGVNLLAATATCEHVLVVNDDVRFVDPAHAAPMARAVARRGAVVAPRLVDAAGTPQASVHALPTPGRVLAELVVLPDRGPAWAPVQKWRQPSAGHAVPAVTAAALVVDRSVLLAHPMPTEYVMYWEEISWCWTLRDHGVPVVVDPRLEVVRDGGRDEVGEAKWRYLGRNLVRLGEERYGIPGRVLYAALAALWLGRLVVTDALRADRRARWSARRAGLGAVGRALVGHG